jgi:hypothetical protein
MRRQSAQTAADRQRAQADQSIADSAQYVAFHAHFAQNQLRN